MEKMFRTVVAIIMLVVIAVSTVGCAGESALNDEKTGSVGAAAGHVSDASEEAKPGHDPIYDIEVKNGKAGLVEPVNLMEGIKGQEVRSDHSMDDYEPGMTDFALRLTKACNETGSDQNILVSPLSVLMGMSMIANGAEGKTLAKTEEVLGFSVDMLNAYAHLYKEKLNTIPSDAGMLRIANSIWFVDNPAFVINREFLQTNADYFDADVYSAPFDQTTVSSINAWVSDKTKGRVPSIVDELDSYDLMALVSAVAFDGEWRDPYYKANVKDGEFHVSSDNSVEATFMYGYVYRYLSDDRARGFIKEYEGRKYAFAALLPDEGINVSDYLNSLTGKHLHEILLNAEESVVEASIPKFVSNYNVDLKDVFETLGLGIVFTEEAEFGRLGEAPQSIYIQKAQHKSFISVYEAGTKAGAASLYKMSVYGIGPTAEQEVYLDRPFVYMLIDMETQTPFFIGVMNNPVLGFH